MGIVVKTKEIYPIYEENCKANQEIALVEAARDDNNENNIHYKAKDSTQVYSYIHINGDTGEITLTTQGVEAVNTDYDDKSLELWSLDFTVIAEDTELGDSIEIDLSVPVVRVNDSAPVVTDEIKYPIYSKDVKEGQRVLDVRTMYPSYYRVINTSSKYFTFNDSQFGACTLTADGVEQAQKIFENGGNQMRLDVEFEDQYCGLKTTRTYYIDLIEGSAVEYVPKKSILENIGVVLGIDISSKFETFKTDAEIKNKYLLNQYFDSLSIDDLGLLENIFKGVAYFETEMGNKYNDTNQSNEIINEYKLMKSIETNRTSLINKGIKHYLQALDKDYTLNYNFQGKISNSNFNLGTNLFNYQDDQSIKNIFYNVMYLKDQIENLVDKKIQSNNESISSVVGQAFKAVHDEFNYVNKSILMNHFTKLGKYIWNTNKRVYKILTNQNKLTNEVSVDSSRIQDIINLLFIDDTSTLPTSAAANYDTYKGDHTTETLTGTSKGFFGWIKAIDDRYLEDWGVNDNDRWQFTNSTDGDGELKYDKLTRLIAATAGDADEVARILMETDDITFEQGKSKFYFIGGDSNCKLQLSADAGVTTIVEADEFDGTASSAKYADIAEYYLADKNYEKGTVLVFDSSDSDFEITLGSSKDQYPIGIVSSRPGYILNSSKAEIPNWNLIALKGRVPVKINSKIKEIKKGSLLYASVSEPGTATPEKDDSIGNKPIAIIIQRYNKTDDENILVNCYVI